MAVVDGARIVSVHLPPELNTTVGPDLIVLSPESTIYEIVGKLKSGNGPVMIRPAGDQCTGKAVTWVDSSMN